MTSDCCPVQAFFLDRQLARENLDQSESLAFLMDARRAAMAAAMGLLAGMGGGPRPGAGAAGASAASSFDKSSWAGFFG